MRVRRVLLNSALGLAVIAVGAVAVTSIGDARTTTPVGQAVPVTRGTLVATVTATGNVQAVDQTELDAPGSGGTVTRIYVKQGQKVTQGQKILKVDDASEKRDLRTARASRASARAQMATTIQGRSAAEAGQDNAAIASAEQSVRNAETTLKAARGTYALDKKQQNATVSDADDALSTARRQLSDARNKLADAAPSDPNIATLTSAVSSAKSSVTSAESALSSAKRTRSATLLKDQQAIDSQKGQVATAAKQVDQQRASAAVNAQPARAGAVESAQAQIDTAQVDVDKAERALADTVLTAPTGGTIATINAVVGQSSSGSAGSSGSSSSTSGSSGAGAGSAGSSTSTTSTSSSSALVVLTDLTHKEISATVAEVDVTKLKLGLKAQIMFPASGAGANGTVTAIDTEQTVTNNVVEYGVKIRMDSGDTGVKIGQTASLTITAKKKDNALIVPTSALRTVDGRPTVTRRVNNVDSPVTVETGLVGTTGTEITSGLAVGDNVVLPTTGGS